MFMNTERCFNHNIFCKFQNIKPSVLEYIVDWSHSLQAQQDIAYYFSVYLSQKQVTEEQ